MIQFKAHQNYWVVKWKNHTHNWHLLVNLKNNYLLKKLLKWASKKCKNFNIYNVVLKKKKERKKSGDIIILHLCTKNLDDMIYSSWDLECDRLKLVILGHFLHFYPSKNQTNQNFENEKSCWRYHHFTRVSKITIIWCMVPEIWSKTNKMFCHYGPFYALLPH